jgi:nitrogen regulatory protein PII
MPVIDAGKYKLIICVLPDDGSDKKLMRALRDEKHINTVNSVNCLGMAVLADAKTKYGKLPEPTLVRKVDVLVPAADADALFDYIYEKAYMGRVGGGTILLGDVAMATVYTLPEGLPDEK